MPLEDAPDDLKVSIPLSFKFMTDQLKILDLRL